VAATLQNVIPESPSRITTVTGPRQLTGSQIIWDVLVRQGVEVVFGYPGGAIMPAYDALPQFPVRHVLVRHEQGAAHMADGFAPPARSASASPPRVPAPPTW
jgi:acetolactate synthase-1/2/3 large subunit